MSNLEELVPPLELCKQIPEGCFEDSVMVWYCKEQYALVGLRNQNIFGYHLTAPAPTWQEIMEDLNEDMSSIEYRDSSPHWVVHSPYTDTTPAGDNVAEALLRYLMDRKGWNK